MECTEHNWLCKNMKKVRSSEAAIPLLNRVKHSFSLWVQFFLVSIVKAFYWVTRKQENILKMFLEYWEFYLVAYWRWLSPKICLKLQSYKSYNSKHMITSTQITNTEIFSFISALVLKLLSRKVLFTKSKNKRNY